MPGHRVEAIANEFIKLAKAESRPLTNMQLQKLPYVAHGWSLALLGDGLVGVSPTAFPYGPVYRSLYEALKRYGSGEVTDFIHEMDGTGAQEFGAPPGEVVKTTLTPDETKLINAVWNSYKKFSGYQLSNMTHQADSPWTITTKEQGSFSDIPNSLIQTHFLALAERRRAVAS